MDSAFENHIEKIIHGATEKFELAGLYTVSSGVGIVPAGASDPEKLESLLHPEDGDQDKATVGKLIQDGEVEAVVFLSLRIGDLAWSERVLDPELYKEKKEFEALMPTEEDIAKPVIAEEILGDDWSDFDFGD
jgi:hypothetical protein